MRAILDFGFAICDLRFWIFDFRFSILDLVVGGLLLSILLPICRAQELIRRFSICDFRFAILDLGTSILDFGFAILDFGFRSGRLCGIGVGVKQGSSVTVGAVRSVPDVHCSQFPGRCREAAFTYIEMLVALAITLLLAALVMPNLVQRKAERDEWVFKTEVRALAGTARERSIVSGDVTALTYDKTAKEFRVLEQLKTGGEEPVKVLAVPMTVEAGKFSADANDQEGDNWRVSFYPDGDTNGGGVEFAIGEETFSLVISPIDHAATIVAGHIPDLSYERWPAGDNAPQT